jgi:hypothetical protein
LVDSQVWVLPLFPILSIPAILITIIICSIVSLDWIAKSRLVWYCPCQVIT